MSHEDDELDIELPALSAADEAYVRDLLASLPPVPVPDDLADRLDAALREEADRGGPAGQVLPAAATVVPLDSRRAARAARSTRILQVAAAGLIVVAGALGVAKLATHGNGTQATAGAPAGGSVDEAVVTHSGHTYTDATLVADVRSLATRHEPADMAAGGGVDASPTGSPSTVSPRAATSPESSGAASAPKSMLVFGTATRAGPALVACLAAVEVGLDQPVTPLAMDQGSYRGQAALIVVLPGFKDPQNTYDVYVVGVGCGVNANAHMLTYQLVEAH
jgi:hypothetical protein